MPAWSGTVRDLERGVDLGRVSGAGGRRWVRLTAALPAATGAGIESDTLTFALRVVLSEVGGSGVAAVSVGGFGTDAVSTHPHQHDARGRVWPSPGCLWRCW